MNKLQKGFTLIELLVVVAIIGILASIVLVSLGTARGKGADASIQGNLGSIRTQAELYASDNSNNYGVQANAAVAAGASCGSAGMWTNSTIAAASKAASIQAALATLDGTANSAALCGSSNNAWFIAVPLKTDATNAWCVDSTGKSGKSLLSAMDGAGEVSTYTCP